MKVTFENNGLRLRLERTELHALVQGDPIGACLHAPGPGWAITVEASDSFTFATESGSARCQLPREALSALAGRVPTRETLLFQLSGDGQESFAINVDVDIRSGPSRRPPR